MAARMYQFLRFAKDNKHWETFVPYTLEKLWIHLDKRLKPEMTWDNYGTYWEVDHIIPITAFNFKLPTDIDFKKCWALKNLQPLEKTENRRKSNKLKRPFQPSLTI
jgi:5-methylcytosine-specific restriction endonuclease McrA